MATQKITEVTQATTLDSNASLLITQPVSGTESLRRMKSSVYITQAGLATSEDLGIVQLDTDTAIRLALNYARQQAWEVERGTKTLTNSATFPFNDSQQSVALTLCRDSTDYIVIAEVESGVGNVGDIHVTDKLVNGFKLAYDGSASSAVINYTVIGGYLK